MTESPAITDPPKKKPGLLRRVVKWFAMITVLLIVVIAGALWYVWHQLNATPDWWTEPVATSPEMTEKATALENRLTREITAIDSLPYVDESTPQHQLKDPPPDQPAEPEEKTVIIHQDELDAWMAEKAPQWLANQNIDLPKEVRSYRVAFQAGRVILAMAIEYRGSEKIMSFIFQPVPTEKGTVRAELLEIGFGRVTMPGTSLELLIEKVADKNPVRRKYLRKLERELKELQQIDLQIQVDDHRLLRLIKAAIANKQAVLTFQTIPL